MSKLQYLIPLSLACFFGLSAQHQSQSTMKQILHTAQAPQAIGPYSQGVGFGNLWFFSGQIALDPGTGTMKNESIDMEIEQVLNNIDALLKAAGASWGDIVKTSIFLLDMNDFGTVNTAYARRFNSDFPARETVAVAQLPRGARVEISVVVARAHPAQGN